MQTVCLTQQSKCNMNYLTIHKLNILWHIWAYRALCTRIKNKFCPTQADINKETLWATSVSDILTFQKLLVLPSLIWQVCETLHYISTPRDCPSSLASRSAVPIHHLCAGELQTHRMTQAQLELQILRARTCLVTPVNLHTNWIQVFHLWEASAGAAALQLVRDPTIFWGTALACTHSAWPSSSPWLSAENSDKRQLIYIHIYTHTHTEERWSETTRDLARQQYMKMVPQKPDRGLFILPVKSR